MENMFVWMQHTLGVSQETGVQIIKSVAAIILIGLIRWIIIFSVY